MRMAIMFDNCGIDHIPKDIKKFTGNKNMTTTVFRIQAYDSVMCGYFCSGFIDFMLKGKNLLDHANLFSPSKYGKSDKIILKYILKRLRLKKCVVYGKYRKFKNPKIYILKTTTATTAAKKPSFFY